MFYHKLKSKFIILHSIADLSKLNKEQKTAVEHRNGPLLVLSGAGTGKTRVLTSRSSIL